MAKAKTTKAKTVKLVAAAAPKPPKHVKIYRAVYAYNNTSSGANLHFSRWVMEDDQQSVRDELDALGSEEPNRPTPVILGWEELRLNAEEEE